MPLNTSGSTIHATDFRERLTIHGSATPLIWPRRSIFFEVTWRRVYRDNPNTIGRMKANIKRKIGRNPNDILGRVVNDFNVGGVNVIQQRGACIENVIIYLYQYSLNTINITNKLLGYIPSMNSWTNLYIYRNCSNRFCPSLCAPPCIFWRLSSEIFLLLFLARFRRQIIY